jgi:hypothetical protein
MACSGLAVGECSRQFHSSEKSETVMATVVFEAATDGTQSNQNQKSKGSSPYFDP